MPLTRGHRSFSEPAPAVRVEPTAGAGSLSIRFDVDTPSCAREGLPALLRISRETGARFTFFVNVGRAVDRAALAREAFARRGRPAHAKRRIGTLRKLGGRGIMRALILNRPVASEYGDLLRQAVAEGHEVGLHGGTNHGTWMRQAPKWPRARLASELEWSMGALAKLGITRYAGFSSPGWQGSPFLDPLLMEYGIRYRADRHGPSAYPIVDRSGVLPTIGTDLTGEPGGVGYFEHCAALHVQPAELRRHLRIILQTRHEPHVTYDHPCFGGLSGQHFLRATIAAARDCCLPIIPMAELITE